MGSTITTEILHYNILQLIKILSPFTIIFIIIPLVLNRTKLESVPLKIVKGLTLSVFTAICTGYFLSFIKSFNLFFISIIYFPLFFLMYLLIEEVNVKKGLLAIGHWLLAKNKNSPNKANSQQPTAISQTFFIIIFLCTFFYLFYLRASHVLYHLAIYYYDVFSHMPGLKAFLSGEAALGPYYPLGQEAIIGLLKLFSNCDVMDIYRILGPVQSTLILFTLYFVVYEITKNKYIALFVTTILGINVSGIFPDVFYRQIIGLHQEFSLIFLLPAVYFAVQYMTKKHIKDLKYLILCICNTLLIHPYISLIALFLFLSVFFTGLLFRLWKIKTIILGMLAGCITALITLFPLVLWSIAQKSPLTHTSKQTIGILTTIYNRIISYSAPHSDIISFLIDMLNPIKDPNKWHNTLSANIIAYTTIISFIYIIGRFLLKKPYLIQHIYIIALALGQALLSVLYYGKAYNFPQIIYYERVALALSLVTFSLLGILLNELFVITMKLPLYLQKPLKVTYIFTACIILLISLITLPYGKVPLLKLQHEGALFSYVKIRDTFPEDSWTIISPVEEYPLTLGYGAHYELCSFPAQYSINDAKDINFSFTSTLPYKNIFIYVEKNPLLIWQSLPLEGSHYESNEPYRLYSNRKKLEKYIDKWMKEYSLSHYGLPNNAKVFYEDKDMKVFHIINELQGQYP